MQVVLVPNKLRCEFLFIIGNWTFVKHQSENKRCSKPKSVLSLQIGYFFRRFHVREEEGWGRLFQLDYVFWVLQTSFTFCISSVGECVRCVTVCRNLKHWAELYMMSNGLVQNFRDLWINDSCSCLLWFQAFDVSIKYHCMSEVKGRKVRNGNAGCVLLCTM